MTKHRFIVNNIDRYEIGDSFELEDVSRIRQIRKVLRLKPKDVVTLVDGIGSILDCQIETVSKEAIGLKVLEKDFLEEDCATKISVALPVLKKDRFEWALQKLTEIGINEVIPIYTERSIIHDLNESRLEHKHERWLSISIEATEQSERPRPPKIGSPIQIEEFLTSLADSKGPVLNIICTARSKSPHIADLIMNQSNIEASPVVPPKYIRIVIGPEGGLTDSEIDLAKKNNFMEAKLGKTILRSETAAIVSATIATTLTEIS